MGRSQCCEKVGLKKGPWTPDEDHKLLAYIQQYGHGSWRALPANAGLMRCGKSCRLRWKNYLRPDIKRGQFSLQEEQTIIQLHALLGNRWSVIATHLPKRTDNEIKNYWNTQLKKRLTKMGIDPVTHKPKTNAALSSGAQFKRAANLSHMAQWESARVEAEARLVRESKLSYQPQLGSFPWDRLLNQATAPGGFFASTGNLESPTSTAVGFTGNPWLGYAMHEMEYPNDASRYDVECSSLNEGFTTDVVGDNMFGSCGGDFEESNSYWSSILNLVNSSPAWSPVF